MKFFQRVPPRFRHGVFTQIEVCATPVSSELECKATCKLIKVNGDREPINCKLPENLIEANKSYYVIVESQTIRGKNHSLKPQPVVIQSQNSSECMKIFIFFQCSI